MNRKSQFFVALLVLVVLFMSGCGGSSSKLTSIAVTPASQSVAVGANTQFTATGTYGNNSTKDITSSVAWSTALPTVATINASTGLATSVLAGGTQVSATSGGVTGTSGLTVNLQQIIVSPSNAQISVGQTQQMSATGSFPGFNQDVTTAVAWSSSDPTVGTIDNNGVFTALVAGTSNITATSGSFSSTVQLIVQ